MESSSTRTLPFLRDLSPSHGEEIEDPKVIQVTDSFSPINHQVRIEQLSCMISSGPRCRLVRFGTDLNPLLSFPIKQADGIESLFVGTSSSKQDQSIVVLIVVHGAIRTQRGYISGCLHFIPFHGDGIEAPKIVHVARVYVDEYVPAYPPKKTTSS